MYQKISIIIVLLICGTVWSQDLKRDFERIKQRMETANAIAIDVDIKMYGGEMKNLTYSSKAQLLKMGASSKNVLDDMEFFLSDKYHINVDHESKAILINTNVELPDYSKQSLDIEKLQKMLSTNSKKDNSKFSLISDNNGVRTYEVTGLEQIKEMTVVLDINRMTIKSVEYEYKPSMGGQYVVLNYTRFDYDQDLSASLNTTQYFTIKNNNYVLNNRFKGYKIYTEE